MYYMCIYTYMCIYVYVYLYIYIQSCIFIIYVAEDRNKHGAQSKRMRKSRPSGGRPEDPSIYIYIYIY